jgi:hypothetical protein
MSSCLAVGFPFGSGKGNILINDAKHTLANKLEMKQWIF